MKIPSDDIMKHGYETWIVNKKQGMRAFGNYDASKFPDYPAYRVDENGNVIYIQPEYDKKWVKALSPLPLAGEG